MPPLASITQALAGLATLVLVALGVTDPRISASVQEVLPCAAAVLLAALAWIHHARTTAAGAQSILAAQVAAQNRQAAQVAQAAPAPGTPGTLTLPGSPAMLAAIGAALEAARTGVVAAPPASGPLTPPAGARTLPGPAIVGTVLPNVPQIPNPAAPPADDYPTQEIPALVDVPFTIGA
jgi:hypothetical protein